MAVIEIQAKAMLTTIYEPDGLFGLNYNMNLYRGCQHQCIYCDSRSQCYGIDNFNSDILVKVNAPELLDQELPRKRAKGVIGTGSMNDPYMPVEKHLQLTRQALERIAWHGFGVHVNTKSDLVLRDVDLLLKINKVHASVCLSITTVDDDLAAKVEPGAPSSTARFAAIRALAQAGIPAGVCLMPVLPFLEDTPENITALVERSAESGASFILPWFGMSLRDRQRAYYYEHIDRLFPGLRGQYERAYGDRYSCPARHGDQLAKILYRLCKKYKLTTHVPPYQPKEAPRQLTLF